MTDLFASGRIVDLILAAVALEAVLLLAYRRRTGRGIRPVGLLATLSAGAALLLALRAALIGAWWGWIALALSVALLAHLVDLAARWRG